MDGPCHIRAIAFIYASEIHCYEFALFDNFVRGCTVGHRRPFSAGDDGLERKSRRAIPSHEELELKGYFNFRKSGPYEFDNMRKGFVSYICGNRYFFDFNIVLYDSLAGNNVVQADENGVFEAFFEFCLECHGHIAFFDKKPAWTPFGKKVEYGMVIRCLDDFESLALVLCLLDVP